MESARVTPVTKTLQMTARAIFDQSLAECGIERIFHRKMTVEARPHPRLIVNGKDAVDLAGVQRIRIVAAGKAAGPMLTSLLALLQGVPCRDVAGILIAPDKPDDLPASFNYFAGGHPLPNQASLDGARAALNMLSQAAAGAQDLHTTLCIFLISGGASAMMESPLASSLTLEDTIAFHRALVHSGASIAEINCVRKHFSSVKGGRLALAAKGVRSIAILVSDVPSGQLDVLSSGPTLADSSTLQQCRNILLRYRLIDRFPPSIRHFFASPLLIETPKPGELDLPSFLLLDEHDLAEAASRQARERGFHTVVDNTCDDWDYRAAAEYLLGRARSLRAKHPKLCLISVGEVTVELPHQNEITPADTSTLPPWGVGGRNQHLALFAATLLRPEDAPLVLLSAGSDGVDGNSSAAGAVVDVTTLQDYPAAPGRNKSASARRESLLAQGRAALQRFDSSTFLAKQEATIIKGPSGNNLRDLRVILTDSSDRNRM